MSEPTTAGEFECQRAIASKVALIEVEERPSSVNRVSNSSGMCTPRAMTARPLVPSSAQIADLGSAC